MTDHGRTEARSPAGGGPRGARDGDPGDEAGDFRFGSRAVLLTLAFWTLYGLLTAGNVLLSPFGAQYPHHLELVGTTMARSYLWAVLTPPIFWMASRLGFERGRRASRALAFLGIGLLTALLVTVTGATVEAWVLPPLAGRTETGLQRVLFVTRFRLLNELVVFAAIVAAGVARDYALRYQARREESVRLQAHAARLQAQLAEARITALRSQLNPHFLFNTLNAVSGLVTRDPKGVRRMIARLSDILRHALDGPRDQAIPLVDELRLLGRYLEILEIRFQGRLRTRIEVEPGAQDALVPNLILQPLAENAMKHGVSRAGGHGRIEVHARRDGDALILSVLDTGPGDEEARAAKPLPEEVGTGLGLRSTRERLAELYGSEQRFELRPTPDGGTLAEIVIPFRARADVRAADQLARA